MQEEKEIVLEIYSTFWETRSLLQTANIISEKYETKHGAKFTTSTIRLILRNPIYCVADEYSYNYFLEHDGTCLENRPTLMVSMGLLLIIRPTR